MLTVRSAGYSRALYWDFSGKEDFARLTQDGRLERVAHGVYRVAAPAA